MHRNSPPASGGRTLGYIRVSTDKQEREGTSLAGQLDDLKRFCKSRGLPDPEIRQEVESATAKRQERRVVLNQVIAGLRAGDVLVCWKLDWFSRSARYTLNTIKEVQDRGARFLSVTENIDPDTPDGRLYLTILAGFAEREHERIRERTVERRRALRREGKVVEGTAPLGYRLADRTLVIDPDEAAIVRHIFARSIAGDSARTIAEDVRRNHGRDLQHTTIAYILRNRKYVGEYESAAWRELVHDEPIGPKRGSGEFLRTHEPIVDRATFERAQRAATARRKHSGRPATASATSTWLVRSLATCGVCGCTLEAKAYSPGLGGVRKPGHDGWYGCRRRLAPRPREERCKAGPLVKRTIVDEAVSSAVADRIDEIRDLIAHPKPQPKAPPIVDYDAARARIAARRAKVVDAFDDGTLSKDDLRVKLTKFDRELADLAVAEQEQRERLAVVDTGDTRRKAVAAFGALGTAWRSNATPEQRRRTVQLLADTVLVHPDGRVEVCWKSDRSARALLI